ncbi:MAG: hypothetical protein ACJA1A_001264 [Saprospiraceae bacterium]|jgi:hypothetical protein
MNNNDSNTVYYVYLLYICFPNNKIGLKFVQLILILFAIVCNEIVIGSALSEEHKISILDTSDEENAESEKLELEGEAETDFANEDVTFLAKLIGIKSSSQDLNISNVTDPILEIHSPPPEQVYVHFPFVWQS